MWPASPKKRVSPDTTQSSPAAFEREPKRTKLEFLDRTREYYEPLRRDSGVATPSTSSPSKPVFPFRAQSVPLDGVPSIDLTSVPPSPRRSPGKGAVEIKRAPSVPPPDAIRMDVDAQDISSLLQFTNPTQPISSLARPTFRYAVNFATPRGSTTTPATPLSPLTPLPPSPSVDRFSGRARDSDSVGTPDVRLDTKATPIVRPSIIGTMKPKRGPSTLQGPKRVTRSVSMKERRVTGEHAWVEHSIVTDASIEPPAIPQPSSEAEAAPIAAASSGSTSLKSKSPHVLNRRSASVSNPKKLRQASMNMFIRPKPTTVTGVPNASIDSVTTSTSTADSSRIIRPPISSPSKLPVPVSSPSKHKGGNVLKPFSSLGSMVDTSIEAGCSTASMPGRSLITLSRALDKLVVPPPSRPNTSMGFVRTDGAGVERSTAEHGKGKDKAKLKARDDTSLPSRTARQGWGTGTFARPTASSLKRAATTTEFGSTTGAAKRMRGRGGAIAAIGGGRPRETTGIFGRAGERASKKTSLPVVMGSPVKGWGPMDDDEDEPGQGGSRLDINGSEGIEDDEEDVFSGSRFGPEKDDIVPRAATNARRESDLRHIDLTTSDKDEQRAGFFSSTLNPASSALQALSESLSSLPQTPTPPKPRAIGTRVGLRSSTTADKESPHLIDGSGEMAAVHGSDGAGPSNTTANGAVNGSGGVKKSSLKILKRCSILVDVRTEQGDDAGSLFIDMLKGLGARIMGRLGQSCTHIVYKNGHPNTLTRYRMLNDPKPAVVSIAWVVECVEKRARVDEQKFKIDVDMINVAGGNQKRRRSMIPKHLIPASPGPDDDMPIHIPHLSPEVDEDGQGEGTSGVDGSPCQDPDVSVRSREEELLPPLERARRRRSALLGGQTRLVFS